MSTATWLDPEIRPDTEFDASDYLDGDGTTDNAAALRELAAEINAAAGDVALYLPAPATAYHFVSDDVDGDDPTIVTITKSGLLIYGDGATSLLTWAGVLTEGDLGGAKGTGNQRLFNLESCSRVLIRDLEIQGDNSGPYVRYDNNQSCVIAVRRASGGAIPSDIMIRDVGFADLAGLPAASPGVIPKRCYMLRCTATNCANGLNINANYGVYFRNSMDATESIECAGVPGVLALNDIVAGKIAAGGTNTENTERPGCIVVGNTISDTPDNNTALLTQESYTDGWLQGNVIEDAVDDGIIVAGLGNEGDYLFDRCAVVNNVVSGCNRGIGLQKGEDHMVADNEFGGNLLSGFVNAAAITPVIRDNTLAGNFLLNTGTSDIVFAGNTFTSGHISNLGTTSTPTDSRSGVYLKLFGDVTEGFLTLQVRNWDEAATVDIPAADLATAGLKVGDRFEILHPYYLLDTPYRQGVYTGNDVTLAMRAVEPPADWTVSTTQPLPTLGPKFNGFLIRTTGRKALTDFATSSAFSETAPVTASALRPVRTLRASAFRE